MNINMIEIAADWLISTGSAMGVHIKKSCQFVTIAVILLPG